MGSIYFWTLLFIIVISGTAVTYKRCIKEKIEHAKIVSGIVFFVIIIVISVITKAELINYLKSTLYTNDNADVNLITLYTFILFSGLYIIFTLITEDLLKNISTFIDVLFRFNGKDCMFYKRKNKHAQQESKYKYRK